MSSWDENKPLLSSDMLLEAGWIQGTLFSASSISFMWNDLSIDSDGSELTKVQLRQMKSNEKLIIVSQDCDIKASEDKEPYVEALICKKYKEKFLTKVSNTSARWFVVDHVQGLVAEAKYRVQLTKQVLSKLVPEPWPAGSKRLEAFVRWLARRYDRPAIPDNIVDVFQKPIEARIALLKEEIPAIFNAFNRTVHDVRVNLPESEYPPFNLQLVLLVNSDGLSDEELDAIDIVNEVVQASVDTALVHLEPEMRILTEAQMSLKEFYATRPLYFDYYTYIGEEIEGAEPHGRV